MRKESSVPKQEEIIMCSNKDLNVDVCIMTKTGWARSKVKSGNLLDGIEHSTKIGDLIKADHKI